MTDRPSDHERPRLTEPAEPAQPTAEDTWDQEQRHETPTERLDRNWTELLQELRVVQTGVQLLAGFLLTLPFQNRFATLSRAQQDIYLVTVALAVAAVCFLIAPVSLHRALFRQHARAITVALAHRLAVAGILLFGAATTGVVLLIFDVVRGPRLGVLAAALCLVLISTLWLLIPSLLRRSTERSQRA